LCGSNWWYPCSYKCSCWIKGKFRGRKERALQNVLAAITFNLKFIYVLAGWEESAHNSRVSGDALSRPSGLKVLEGIN